MYRHKLALIVAHPDTNKRQIAHMRALAFAERLVPITLHPRASTHDMPRAAAEAVAHQLPGMEGEMAHRVAMSGGRLWVALGLDPLPADVDGIPRVPPAWLRVSLDPWRQALGRAARGRLRIGTWDQWAESIAAGVGR